MNLNYQLLNDILVVLSAVFLVCILSLIMVISFYDYKGVRHVLKCVKITMFLMLSYEKILKLNAEELSIHLLAKDFIEKTISALKGTC